MNISLTQEDFRTLVNGGIVKKDGESIKVSIALQDIGYHVMLDEVSKAQEKTIDEEVTHEKFFGENIKRVQEFLKSKKLK